MQDALLTLGQAARLVPTRPTVSTLRRWCRTGQGLPDGGRLYLEYVKVGRRLFTREDWLNAFLRHLGDAERAAYGATALRPVCTCTGRAGR